MTAAKHFISGPMLLIACTFLLSGSLAAKQQESLLCRYYPATFADTVFPEKVVTFAGAREAKDVVNSIVTAVLGHASRFEVREAPAMGRNAAAAVCSHVRYIFYGPEFIDSLVAKTGSYWSGVSILAHEVGHHIHGHTLEGRGSRPDIEIEADHFSGFALQRMDASLDEAIAAMRAEASISGSSTHPPRAARLKAIEEGWIQSCQEDSSCTQGGGKDNDGAVVEPGSGRVNITIVNHDCHGRQYEVFRGTQHEEVATIRLRANGDSKTLSLVPGSYNIRICVDGTNDCENGAARKWSKDTKIYLLRHPDCN